MVIRIFQKTSKNIVTGCVEDNGEEKKEKWCEAEMEFQIHKKGEK